MRIQCNSKLYELPCVMLQSNYPAYKKAAVIHLWIIMIVITLYYLKVILVPLGFAALLAVLLNPVSLWLKRRGLGDVVSVTITVTVAVLVTFSIIYLLYTQVALFATAIPKLQDELNNMIVEAQRWLSMKFNVYTPDQNGWLNSAVDEYFGKSDKLIKRSLNTISSLAIALTLIPVYVFLLLLYRDMLIRFLLRVFIYSDTNKVNDILHETRTVIQSYVTGLMLETLIIAVLNTAGLLLLGIDYAIVLGVLGALLNMVPYIGGIIAMGLTMLIAMVDTEGFFYPLAVVGLYSLVQFVDNNLIVPKIVAGRVKINAIISIVAVIAGGELWGVSGMFLSIPFMAILKIIFDRVEALKPWGMLLGVEYPADASRANVTTSFWQQTTTITVAPPTKPDEEA